MQFDDNKWGIGNEVLFWVFPTIFVIIIGIVAAFVVPKLVNDANEHRTQKLTPTPELSSAHNNPAAGTIKQKMREVIIPVVNRDNVDVLDAVNFWNTTGLEDGGWNTVATLGTEHKRVTIKEENISALDLLNEICHQADLVWFLEPRFVSLKPK